MYKYLFILSAFIFLMSVPMSAVHANDDILAHQSHVSILSSDQGAVRLGFDLSDINTQDVVFEGDLFTSFAMTGEGIAYEYGKPLLPAVIRYVVVPGDVGLELIVDADEPRRVQADGPPALCMDEDIAPPLDQIQDGRIGLYPPVIAEMDDPVVIRGIRLVKVTTYPVQYDETSDCYLQYDRIDTEIRFTDDDPINPATHPIRRHRSKNFLKFMEGIAINADQIGRDDIRDEEPPYVGHYLVVTNENILNFDGLGEFIEWRRRSGYKVDVLSVPNNIASNQGRCDDIKEMIQDIYDAYLDDGIDPFDNIMLVGDRTHYDNCGASVGAVLGCPRGNNIWGGEHIHHYDWFYGKLEGNDEYADVGVSRWAAGTEAMIDLWWGRTKAYEVEPYMEDTDWFTRGAVYAQRWAGNYHPSLATNVRWGKSVLESLGFDDIRLIESMTNANVNEIGAFLREQFNDGCNVMVGRAENYHFRYNFNGVNDNVVFPIDLNIAGHHEWTMFWMTRDVSANGAHLRGPVAATTGYGGQQTLPYSICWLEEVNGFLLKDMPLGWARLQSLIGPTLYIPRWWQTYPQLTTDVSFFGDPGIQYWRGVPLVVEAEYPESITPNTKIVEVRVTDPEEDVNVAGAQVTIYVPGDMPAYDHNDYPDYDDMQM
ncbi:MAG: C25 family cysteine peptidase, partial [Candidatus Electryoneaceae bacterium]|nr:C25 family cysteine peptidase [Candidatus Electryoneaceae bacterium]